MNGYIRRSMSDEIASTMRDGLLNWPACRGRHRRRTRRRAPFAANLPANYGRAPPLFLDYRVISIGS